MKMIKNVTLSIGLIFSASSMANCSLPYKYTNSILTPPLVTAGTAWSGSYIMTNVSSYPITIKFNNTDVNGNIYTPFSVTYADNFSAANTPLNLTQGAVLQPGHAGTLTINDPSTVLINVGKISWFSDVCLSDALMVSYVNQFNLSPRITRSLFPLNNGFPF
jgi:hypothetical protein